uniref:Uncharacterized protein n=1 Tax=Astyanax mexicanus TaxID=7994 RepID=A0A8B9JHA2_ASTMX
HVSNDHSTNYADTNDARMNAASITSAFGYSIWYSSTRRINHRHQANEAQVLSGEVHIFCIECKAFWELVIWEIIMAETCNGEPT